MPLVSQDPMAAALAEYRRVLADGGLLLLAVHAGQEVWHSADWFGAKVDVSFRFFDPAWLGDRTRARWLRHRIPHPPPALPRRRSSHPPRLLPSPRPLAPARQPLPSSSGRGWTVVSIQNGFKVVFDL